MAEVSMMTRTRTTTTTKTTAETGTTTEEATTQVPPPPTTTEEPKVNVIVTIVITATASRRFNRQGKALKGQTKENYFDDEYIYTFGDTRYVFRNDTFFS